MCFIHVLHTCASCALYAHGRIVGLLGLVILDVRRYSAGPCFSHNMEAKSNLSFIKRGIGDDRSYYIQWLRPQNSVGEGHLERIRWADGVSV